MNRLMEQGAEVPFIGKISVKSGSVYMILNIPNNVLELITFNEIE